MTEVITLRGEYANLRLLADDLERDVAFGGRFELALDSSHPDLELAHSPWADLTIHILESGVSGASAAAAKAAVEAAINRARRRSKLKRSDGVDDGNGAGAMPDA